MVSLFDVIGFLLAFSVFFFIGAFPRFCLLLGGLGALWYWGVSA